MQGTVEDAHLDFIQLINTIPHHKVILEVKIFLSRSAKKFIGHYIVFINVEEGKIHFCKKPFLLKGFFFIKYKKKSYNQDGF